MLGGNFKFLPYANHIHLLLKQIKDKGIPEFMRKFGAGYVGYFNKKYNRKGPLFGKFRAVLVQDNFQLKAVFVYIHTNPVSLVESNWKEKGAINPERAIKFLESYRWSSYSDYLGGKIFPLVIESDFLLGLMGGVKNCKEFIEDWIKHKKEINFPQLLLE
jgi:putative transposase